MKDRNLIVLVTFTLFSAEAYMHYNTAKNEGKKDFKWYRPSRETTIKNLAIVGLFSVLNAYIIESIKK